MHKLDKLRPNTLSSCPKPMTLDTQMTLALLQELLMVLRANDADRYKSWLASVLNVNPSTLKRFLNACELCFKYWTADLQSSNAKSKRKLNSGEVQSIFPIPKLSQAISAFLLFSSA